MQGHVCATAFVIRVAVRGRSTIFARGLAAFFAVVLVIFAATKAHADPPSIEGSHGSPSASDADSVDVRTGAAHASLAIDLPKPRGSVSVGLGLSYSSQAIEGEAGVGWGFNLPAIVRHNVSGAPRYNDPKPGLPLEPWLWDRFQYQGASLIYVCTIGQDGCTADDFPRQYNGFHYFRRERESGFERFLWSADGRSWVVQQPDGQTLELGEPLSFAQITPIQSNGIDAEFSGLVLPSAWRIVRRFDARRDQGEPVNLVVYHWWASMISGPKTITDIFDTPLASKGPSALDSYAHHVRFGYTREKPSFSKSTHAPVWRARRERYVSTITVTSATEKSTARQLVRRYQLSYEDRQGRIYLTKYEVEGCEEATENADGELSGERNCSRLPGTVLTYYPEIQGRHGWSTLAKGAPLSSGRQAPALASKPKNVSIADITGDGLPDFVQVPDTPGAQQHLWVNTGSALRYATLDATTPNGEQLFSFLKSISIQSDWMGLGRASVLNSAGAGFPTTGFMEVAERVGTGAWLWKEANAIVLPPFELLFDIDGDGLVDAFKGISYPAHDIMPKADISLSAKDVNNGVIRPFDEKLSYPKQQLEVPFTLLEQYSTKGTWAADMDGDGITDLVYYNIWHHSLTEPRWTDPKIVYFPGDGTGRFGCSRYIECDRTWPFTDKPISMNSKDGADSYKDSLLLSENSGGREYVHDINGDGRGDLIVEQDTTFDVFLNQGSLGFGPKTTIPHPRIQDGVPMRPEVRVVFADVNGSGTDDIVFMSGKNIYFSEWVQGPRAGLLSTIENGYGGLTLFEYDMLAQLDATAESRTNRAWTDHVPLNLPVLTRVSRTNLLDGPLRVHQITSFDYRDPAYDAWERRLLGFGSVTHTTDDSLSTETLYYFGNCERSSGTCQTAYQGIHDPDRLRSGLPYSREVRRKDVTLSTTLYSNDGFYLEGLPGVSFAYPKQTDTYLYETSPFVRGNGSVEVTVFAGFQDRSLPVTVKLPLRSDDYDHLRTTRLLDASGRLAMSVNHGRIQDDGTAIDDPIVHRENWTRIPSDTMWTWRKHDETTEPFAARPGLPASKPRTNRYDYDTSGNLYAIYAQLEGGVDLDRSHEDPSAPFARTAPGASSTAPHEIRVGNYIPDRFGNVALAQSATGRCEQFTYDALYQQLLVSESSYPKTCGVDPITMTSEYDRGNDVVTRTVAPNGAEQRMHYDVFGRITGMEKPDPVTGRTTGASSTTVKYDERHGSKLFVHQVHVTTREGDEAWSLTDGLGNAVETFQKAEPSAAGTPRWVAAGLAIRNRLGRVTERYEPFFVEGSDPLAKALDVSSAGAITRYGYDDFARPTLAFAQDGTQLSAVAYHKLLTESQDAESVIPGGLHANTPSYEQRNGHGRVIQAWKRIHSPASDSIVTSADYLATGEVARVTQAHVGPHAQLVPGSSHWMLYDSLGRAVVNAEPNTSVNFADADTVSNGAGNRLRSWRYAYNDDGDLVGTSDARGCGKNIQYDAAGRAVGEDYSPCLRSQATYTPPDWTTGDGTELFNVYDAGGRLRSTRDRGAFATFDVDFRGRLTHVSRQIVKPGTPEIRLAQRYAPRIFHIASTFDDQDRPVRQSSGADVEDLLVMDPGLHHGVSDATVHYSPRGFVDHIGSSYGTLLKSKVVAADGFVEETIYGDKADLDLVETRASLTPDARRRPKTFVLDHAPVPAGWQAAAPPQTSRQITLAAWTFDLDAVGNVKSIRDDRLRGEWPDGAKPVHRTMAYDDLSRVTDVTYDSGGDKQRSPWAAELQARSFRAVPARDLPSRVTHQAFAYDWQGNTTSTTADADPLFDRSLGPITNGFAGTHPHQLASAVGGSIAADYDPSGNLAHLVIKGASGCTSPAGKCSSRFAYDWDEVGRLARAQRWDLPDRERFGADLRYAYDASGQRVLKTSTNAVGEQLHSVEIFGSLRLNHAKWLPGPSGPDYERTAQTETAYVGGLGRVAYLETNPITPASGQVRVLLLLGDHLGSTSSVVDLKSGELVEQSTFQAQGAVDSDYRPERWGSFREDYRFTGKEEDSEVGLTYFGQRYYHARLGRWISADPLNVHTGGSDSNPYAYVRGQLFNAVDPDGLDPRDIFVNGDNTGVKGDEISGRPADIAAAMAAGAILYHPSFDDLNLQVPPEGRPIVGPGAGMEMGDDLVSDWAPAPLIGDKYSPYPMGDPRESAGMTNGILEHINIRGVLDSAMAPKSPGSDQYKTGELVGAVAAAVVETVVTEVASGGAATGVEIARAERVATEFTASESRIARMLRGLGKSVAKNPKEGLVGAGRQGDAFVNGVLTEFKSLIPGAGSNTIKNAVNNSIRRGGQARSIVIDARNSGLSFDAARQGVARALGISRGMVDEITVFGDGFMYIGGL